MIRRPPREVTWHENHQSRTVALNVGGRYVTLAVELVLGLLMLPINTRYLGASDYGLWILSASIVAYFPVLDLGYGSAMERFIAHYRTQKDAKAINEITGSRDLLSHTFSFDPPGPATPITIAAAVLLCAPSDAPGTATVTGHIDVPGGPDVEASVDVTVVGPVKFLNVAFNTRAIPPAYFAVPALCNFVKILFYDEMRKILVRKGTIMTAAGRIKYTGWMARNTYW